ncbi:MAG: hypothetical protein HY537_12995 [Deltaproteobacteria bacterium]|nr:hypothetical protein [Deltaproteobacteria bacterium]
MENVPKNRKTSSGDKNNVIALKFAPGSIYGSVSSKAAQAAKGFLPWINQLDLSKPWVLRLLLVLVLLILSMLVL